ncbi:hypothetical protein C8R43DRAFT_1203399 [Mycena crocata]|nr:hypothetical protein C8R43DRAFT_1203399 [Mycena crocata]
MSVSVIDSQLILHPCFIPPPLSLDMGRLKLAPVFPVDLERRIFEISAHIRPSGISTLLLVARRVKAWLEPLLYRTIMLTRYLHPSLMHRALMVPRNGASAPEDATRTYTPNLVGHPTFGRETLARILKSKSEEFLASSVRHLFLDLVSVKDANSILSICTNVDNLWIVSTAVPDFLPLIERLPLKRLHCYVHNLFRSEDKINFRHRIFTQITHLELLGKFFRGYECPEIWRGLALVPNLTHLAFEDEAFIPLCPALLQTCKSLRVIVVLMPLDRLADMQLDDLARDPRFLVMDCEYHTRDWRVGAHTGIDYWSRAETFVKQREAGEIDPLEFSFADESVHIA